MIKNNYAKFKLTYTQLQNTLTSQDNITLLLPGFNTDHMQPYNIISHSEVCALFFFLIKRVFEIASENWEDLLTSMV